MFHFYTPENTNSMRLHIWERFTIFGLRVRDMFSIIVIQALFLV